MKQKKLSDQVPKNFPVAAVVIAGVFLALLNQTVMNTALPSVMQDLHISANTAQWLTTAYMLMIGIIVPITAFFTGRFTTRKLFLGAMAIFLCGTLICACAVNFPVLLIGRILQAIATGITMPLMQTVIFMIYPIEKRGWAMGIAGIATAFAPAIGPTFSGWIVDYYSWRVVFAIVLPIVVIDMIVAYFVLKNVTKLTFTKLDVWSVLLSTLGFGGLLYGLSSAGNSGWGAPDVVITLIVGVIALGLFIRRQLILKFPILDFRLFKYSIFTITTVISMIVYMSMMSAELILPLYMQNMRGFSALESGLLLLPGGVIMGIMSPITGKIFDKIGVRWLAIVGLIITTVTTFLFTNLNASTTYVYLVIVYATRMFGLSMLLMPITVAGINHIPKDLIPHGTAMSKTMRQIAASIGTALLVTMTTATTLTHSTQNMIHGVNAAFTVSSGLAFLALILSFFIKKPRLAKKN